MGSHASVTASSHQPLRGKPWSSDWALRNPRKYKSCWHSLQCNPVLCLWGKKPRVESRERRGGHGRLCCLLTEKTTSFLPRDSDYPRLHSCLDRKASPCCFVYKRVMLMAPASLRPSLLITSDIIQNTRMLENFR